MIFEFPKPVPLHKDPWFYLLIAIMMFAGIGFGTTVWAVIHFLL